jgi:DNA-directed RNA polymerase beta' subunit
MTNGTRGDPYSHPDDNNPETKGYERKTLTEGMSPQGTVSHMKATRGNLIDMTSKTADAGEDHHLKNKMLIDAKVDYLSSTRDTNGVVMEFVTGHVGLDPMHIVTVKNDNKTVEFYVDIGVLVDEAISAVLWDLDEEQDYLTANPILQEDQ